MNWIRIAVTLPDDPRIHEFAATLKLDVDRALAKFLRVLFKLPEHARNGDISGVLPQTIETWADWRGRRGAFDTAFRLLFCNADGVIRAWEKHNGAAMRRADEDRERKRVARGNPQSVRNLSAGQNAERPPDKMRDGTGRNVTGEDQELLPPPAHEDKFDDAAHVQAYRHFWNAAKLPTGLDAELDALHSGLHGKRAVPWGVLGQAMHEMATGNHPFSVRHFGGFVRKISLAPDPSAALAERMGRRLTVGEENYLRGLKAVGLAPPAPSAETNAV